MLHRTCWLGKRCASAAQGMARPCAIDSDGALAKAHFGQHVAHGGCGTLPMENHESPCSRMQ